ncbi:tachykinin-like peptides receptor 99D [Amphiura filiformis]|uniref:tachykinin-like peptides receptor 99D n=1 Tax=Amphiura filiformis TaxID=82378 RepID=UPI003B20D945
MAVCYSIMGVKLWGNDVIGEQVQNRSRQIKAKRKVVKMIVVVTITFAVCWLPLHVYNLLGILYPEAHMQPYSLNLYLAIWCLAMTSSMYNPIIYCWMNDRFRDGFKKVFRCMKPTIDSKPDHFRGGVTATSGGPPTTTSCQMNNYQKQIIDGKSTNCNNTVVSNSEFVDDTTC